MKTLLSSLPRLVLVALAALLVFSPQEIFAKKKPKKMLVVTVTKGFRHSSIPTAERVIGEIAQKSGDFTVDYVRQSEDDREMKEKMTMEKLKEYDGVIFANTTGDLPLPDKQGFLDWIQSGKGFVGMHSASDTFRGHNPLDPYVEMVGGEFKSHPPGLQDVECIVQDSKHPACAHFGPTFNIKDEIYILNGFQRPTVHGLLTLDKHPQTGWPGDFPIAWCKNYGKGKMFYTSLGHAEAVWENPEYQKHILGGIRWALGLEKGDATPQSTAFSVSEEEAKEGFRRLFNGVDLSGWKLRHPGGSASWSVQNGMLVNTPPGNAAGNDIVTEEQFRDFVIRYEYMIPKGSNSGLYLRGRHEIQIFDDYGSDKPAMGGNGAVYSISPAAKLVTRPPGQWQSVEAALKGDRVTVILNGETIHDNLLVNKATGGELDKNLDLPGPFMLQGDHGPVAFRNMRIKVLK